MSTQDLSILATSYELQIFPNKIQNILNICLLRQRILKNKFLDSESIKINLFGFQIDTKIFCEFNSNHMHSFRLNIVEKLLSKVPIKRFLHWLEALAY